MTVMKSHFYKLILVTNFGAMPLNSSYWAFITSCARAGITAVQLREKSLSYEDLLKFGRQLKSVLKPFDIPLIVNDSVRLAHELDADGVHLGQSDGCTIEARKLLGRNKIIGQSIESIKQLHLANKLPIDYVGVSAIFFSTAKQDVATIWGCAGLRKIAAATHHTIVAIGGINVSNACQVMEAGAHGIAAVGAFHDVQDPSEVTANLRNIVEGQNYDKKNRKGSVGT